MIKTPKENMRYIKFHIATFFKTFGFKAGDAWAFNSGSKKHINNLTIQGLIVNSSSYEFITKEEFKQTNLNKH